MKNFVFLNFLLLPILCIGQTKVSTSSISDTIYKSTYKLKKISVYLLDESCKSKSDNSYNLPPSAKKIDKNDTVLFFVKSKSEGFIEWRRVDKSALSTATNDTISLDPNGGVSKSFLKIHGNVLYDVNYNSRIDTPYAEKDVYQHTVQTYLDITVKDQYPMRFYFTTRFSNSNLFRNFSDLGLQFDPLEFRNKIKEKLKSRISPPFSLDSLQALKHLLQKKTQELYDLQNWEKNPATIQKLVEERENQLYGPQTKVDPIQFVNFDDSGLTAIVDTTLKKVIIQKSRIKNDPANPGKIFRLLESVEDFASSRNTFKNRYDRNKSRIDSVQSELLKLDQLYKEGNQILTTRSAFSTKEIDAIKDTRVLKSKLTENGIPDTALPEGYQLLWGLRSLKIGRSVVDYSELSAKNISIKGLQAEFNPHYYYAVATGFIDYSFRDFIVRNRNTSPQYLNLIRAGKGLKEENNIIITHYSGSRQLYNSSTTSQGFQIPNYKLMGFTVEGQLKVNKTSFITGEVAKSSVPYYSTNSGNKNLLSSTFRMKDHSNEAYAIKFTSFITPTRTKLSGYYRHYGANFQSFSVFTSGSEQSSWAFKIEQPFFKRHLSLTSSVRANDFTNPFINREYKSTTIFKSIQVTLRMKKLPVLSLGYFPSSQLTKLNDGQFIENLFYTLMASANHFYRHKEIMFNTSLVYTQFYNKEVDSNFVYFNTKNLFLSQNILLRKLSLQFNFSGSSNTDYQLYTYEHNLQYKLTDCLRIGAGVKYNRQTVYNKELWGYSGNVLIRIPKAGEVQFSIDKGFIPGSNKELVENRIGRLTFFKIF